MRINDKYSLKESGKSIAVVEKVLIKIKLNGSFTGETKEGTKEYFYGTVYQALQGLLNVHLSNQLSNQSVIDSIKGIMADIYNAEELIKKTFRTEVLVVR